MHNPSAFALFCAYHLGLDVKRPDRVRHMNAHDVARVVGIDVDAVSDALHATGLDAAQMMARDFDLVGARMDLEVSPPGVDLLSLAQMHWELYQRAPVRTRDWQRELDDDARQNAITFGARIANDDDGNQ